MAGYHDSNLTRFDSGGKYSDPATQAASRDDQLRKNLQCFLMFHLDAFAHPKNRPSRYPYITCFDGDPANVKQRLLGVPDQEGFMDMTPDQYAGLVPRIKIWVVQDDSALAVDEHGNQAVASATVGMANQKEVFFASTYDPKDIRSITTRGKARGAACGLKEFTYEEDGGAVVDGQRMLTARLVFVGESLSALETNPDRDAYASPLDLAIVPPKYVLSAGKSVSNRDYYTVRITFGWSAPQNILKTMTSKQRQAIDRQSTTLILFQSETPKISMNEDGSVELELTYQARMSGSPQDPQSTNVLYDREWARARRQEIDTFNNNNVKKFKEYQNAIQALNAYRQDQSDNAKATQVEIPKTVAGAMAGHEKLKNELTDEPWYDDLRNAYGSYLKTGGSVLGGASDAVGWLSSFGGNWESYNPIHFVVGGVADATLGNAGDISTAIGDAVQTDKGNDKHKYFVDWWLGNEVGTMNCTDLDNAEMRHACEIENIYRGMEGVVSQREQHAKKSKIGMYSRLFKTLEEQGAVRTMVVPLSVLGVYDKGASDNDGPIATGNYNKAGMFSENETEARKLAWQTIKTPTEVKEMRDNDPDAHKKYQESLERTKKLVADMDWYMNSAAKPNSDRGQRTGIRGNVQHDAYDVDLAGAQAQMDYFESILNEVEDARGEAIREGGTDPNQRAAQAIELAKDEGTAWVDVSGHVDRVDKQGLVKLHYVRLGDVVSGLIRNTEKIALAPQTARILENDKKNKDVARILMGPMWYRKNNYNSDVPTSEWAQCCLADVPISLSLLQLWYLEEVVGPQRTEWSLRSFMTSLLTKVVFQAMGGGEAGCWDNSDGLSLGDGAAGIRIQIVEALPDENDNCRMGGFRTRATEGDILSDTGIFGVSGVAQVPPGPQNWHSFAKPFKYLVISANALTLKSFVGDELADLRRGCYWFGYGRDRGPVKKIEFDRVDDDTLQTAMKLQPKSSGTTQIGTNLIAAYKAKIKLLGCHLFKLGAWFFVDTRSVGSADDYRISRALGFGGYYIATKIYGKIDQNGWEMEMDAFPQLTSGDVTARKEYFKNRIAEGGVFQSQHDVEWDIKQIPVHEFKSSQETAEGGIVGGIETK